MILVVGNGMAGHRLAQGLRRRNSDLPVTVLGAEPRPAYNRVLLSAVLAGTTTPEALELPDPGVEVRLDARVVGIDTRTRRVTLADDETLDYDELVLATGSRATLPPVEGLAGPDGVPADGVVTLATTAAGVHAIGECAEHRGRCQGLVGPCWEQADVLADLLSGANPAARYTGSAMITRLKARDVDLAAMGSLDEGPDVEVVRVSDAARGRYGAVAVRDGRIAGAVLLGLPDATGPVIQLHDSGAPAPADRFSLLLGRATPAATDSPAQLPARAVVCRCNGVTKGELVTAWRCGSRDVAALALGTRATTGCGSCAPIVQGLCHWLDETNPEPELLLAEQEGAA